MEAQEHTYTNALIHETSPYLLQHAHNPVNWMPWGEAALKQAREEDKLLLISIGYSACHWCHVMEHESFEDTTVARVMNENYICIKVDREERPDVDQVYMNAVQLMTRHGGWPLNCVALPDGRPVWGGTYFPKEKWLESIQAVADFYRKDPQQMGEYAQQLTAGIRQMDLVPVNTEPADFTMDALDELYTTWSKRFDNKEGGPAKAPKFPLPNNYRFLLRYGHHKEDQKVLEHVELTLRKMAWGGIYDQVGGGFARYSTDLYWKVPHFEKMLYDNAQLVSLYSEAWQAFKEPLYKEVVYQSLEFIEREMTAPEGAFYSALDADSEGEEGKFYIWSKEELKQELGADYDLFAAYYNVNSKGLWEQGHYILLRDKSAADFAGKAGLSPEALREKVTNWQKQLLKVRAKRIRPGLDDKSLTSWNAMMVKGYVDAYQAFDEKEFLDKALTNARFILKHQWQEDGSLYHSYKKGRSTIEGYLEDYAFTIEAFLALHEATFDATWLQHARKLADYVIDHFSDQETGMFFFTSDQGQKLISKSMEVSDNVIPASNSVMAKNLFLLSHYFNEKTYKERSIQMLNNVKEQMPSYGSGYSNWALLMLDQE